MWYSIGNRVSLKKRENSRSNEIGLDPPPNEQPTQPPPSPPPPHDNQSTINPIVPALILFQPGARPTNNNSIEFEIRPKFAVLWFKMYSTDHNEILHTVVTCAKFHGDWWNIFQLELSQFWSNFEFDRNIVNGTGPVLAHYGYRDITNVSNAGWHHVSNMVIIAVHWGKINCLS